jgi:hypothetical protein
VSHAKELAALIADDAPEGAEAYVRKLRREWRKRSARYSVEIV